MTSAQFDLAAVTAREREVLSLIEAHLTNRQIADALCLSVRTVESHVSSLIRKYGVADRRSLARTAERVGGAGSRDTGRWPVEVTSFVGRATERAALLTAATEHRMVTVTGPGGVGKTRLARVVARALAADRRDGGWFVDLARVTDPDLVVGAVARAVGVAEPPGGALIDAVTAALGTADAVLVLDNCEHLLDAVRDCVARCLSVCPRLNLIITSRVRLAAPYEWVYEVPGLSASEDGGDAVELFLDRAGAAGGTAGIDVAQVDVLCRALDGMALAVELAAGRHPSLGVDGLLAGLDQRLDLLATGARRADRHESLRDALAWSHDLLGAVDQDVLAAVSVFVSDFGLDDAVAVVGPTTAGPDVLGALARLADHHLLVAAPGRPTRYRALETIRQFAAERLERAGRTAAARERHRAWCRAGLAGLAGQPHDAGWCVRFDRLADDVSAAIRWAVEDLRDEDVRALAEPLAAQLLLRGRPAEAQRRFAQAARHAPARPERLRLLQLAAGAAAARVAGNDTLALLDQVTTEALAVGDRETAAASRAWMAIYTTMMPGIMASVPTAEQSASWLAEARRSTSGSAVVEAAVDVATASSLPESDPAATQLAARARRRAHAAGAPLVESVALDQLCAVALARGELSAAIDLVGERGRLLDRLPLDASTAYQVNDYLLMASEVHLAAGDLTAAAGYADRLADLATYREQPHLATSRRIKVDAMAGDLAQAAEQGERFLAAWQRAGRPVAGTLNVTTYALALVHALLGDEAARRAWLEVTRAISSDPTRLVGCRTGFAPTFDALVALDRGEPDAALARLSADVDDRSVWGTWIMGLWRPWYAAVWVEAAVLAGSPEVEDRLRRGAAASSQNPIAAAIVGRAAAVARGDRDRLATFPEQFATLGCRYQERRSRSLLGR